MASISDNAVRSEGVTVNSQVTFTVTHALAYQHHDDRTGGRHSSGVRAPFDRFADALTATRAPARVRSLAKSLFRCTDQAAPPEALALARGTMWSTSSSDALVKRRPV